MTLQKLPKMPSPSVASQQYRTRGSASSPSASLHRIFTSFIETIHRTKVGLHDQTPLYAALALAVTLAYPRDRIGIKRAINELQAAGYYHLVCIRSDRKCIHRGLKLLVETGYASEVAAATLRSTGRQPTPPKRRRARKLAIQAAIELRPEGRTGVQLVQYLVEIARPIVRRCYPDCEERVGCQNRHVAEPDTDSFQTSGQDSG